MNTLHQILNTLKQRISSAERNNKNISTAEVSWHIEHSLKVIINIANALKTSNPAAYKWKFNKYRIIVLLLKKIPRGKGKAPAPVNPTERATKESLTQMCVTASEKINELESLQANHYFAHPFFGDLNLKTAKKFLIIHTNHHLKIIEDIVA